MKPLLCLPTNKWVLGTCLHNGVWAGGGATPRIVGLWSVRPPRWNFSQFPEPPSPPWCSIKIGRQDIDLLHPILCLTPSTTHLTCSLCTRRCNSCVGSQLCPTEITYGKDCTPFSSLEGTPWGATLWGSECRPNCATKIFVVPYVYCLEGAELEIKELKILSKADFTHFKVRFLKIRTFYTSETPSVPYLLHLHFWDQGCSESWCSNFPYFFTIFSSGTSMSSFPSFPCTAFFAAFHIANSNWLGSGLDGGQIWRYIHTRLGGHHWTLCANCICCREVELLMICALCVRWGFPEKENVAPND